MRKKIILIVSFSLLLLNIIYSKALELNGYYKSSALFIPDSSHFSKTEGVLNQKIRLNVKYNIIKNWNFNFSYELLPSIKGNAYSNNMNYQKYRIADFDKRLFPKNQKNTGNMEVNQNLDRLFFSFYLPFADLYTGRQAISWGSGHIINPTDLFLSYSFDELDREEKIGVDALRMRIPFGMMSEIDMGAVFGEKMLKNNSAYYSRFKFHRFKADFFFLIMYFKEHLLYGFDFTRSIKGAGAWVEAAYVDNFINGSEIPVQDNYFRLTAGFDYYFSNNTYIIIEYHLNTAGENRPANYGSLYDKEAYKDGNVYLMGKNYINLIYNYQITGLINNSNTVLYNLSDNSLCINPAVEYNISQNIYLNGGIFLYLDPLRSQNKKEFEYYDNFIYSAFKIYF